MWNFIPYSVVSSAVGIARSLRKKIGGVNNHQIRVGPSADVVTSPFLETISCVVPGGVFCFERSHDNAARYG
jgi:hypothetical protein